MEIVHNVAMPFPSAPGLMSWRAVRCGLRADTRDIHVAMFRDGSGVRPYDDGNMDGWNAWTRTPERDIMSWRSVWEHQAVTRHGPPLWRAPLRVRLTKDGDDHGSTPEAK